MMLDDKSTELCELNNLELAANPIEAESTIALLHCYDLIDDFLDSINISFETYCQQFIGSWMFGYINALKLAGVKTVLFCISARVTESSRFIHIPSGTKICVLPPSRTYLVYREIRNLALKLYGGNDGESFTDIQYKNNARNYLLTKVKDVAKSFGSYLSTPLKLLAQEIRREGCSAILCQEYEYARFDSCTLLGKFIGLPVFATFQGGNETQSMLEYPIRQLAFKQCAGVIISTQSEIERVQKRYKLSSEKIARIFDPMDTNSWCAINRKEARNSLEIPLDAKVVVCHGRIEFHRKGLDILLKAWQQICNLNRDYDLRLLLVGTGSDSEKLRARIAQMKLRGIMWHDEFVNERSLLLRYLCAADVYTLASRQEGFPIAPIEAMSCGLPVVASDAPGIPDILEGGELSGGIIVPRENADALAEAICTVLDNPTWASELGKRARCRVEEYFAPESVGKQLRNFLLP
jgi:starch synthase